MIEKSQKLAGVAVQDRISLFNSPTYGTFSCGRSQTLETLNSDSSGLRSVHSVMWYSLCSGT